MHLYEDTTRRPAEPDKPVEPADIDLERALWDMEYRRQVLEILRRSRHNEADPTPANPDHGKKGP